MPDLIYNLHTAARRYLVERYNYWCDYYGSRFHSTGARYSSEARDTFPRYQVLNAILRAVEQIVPSRTISVSDMRQELIIRAREANDMFTQGHQGAIEQRAIAEERALCIAYLESLSEEVLMGVEPLPYRRVLMDDEVRRLWKQLASRWDIEDEYWFPLVERDRSDLLAVQAPYFERKIGAPILQQLLRDHGIERLYELREDGTGYELDLALFEPTYTGYEGYWCTADTTWVVYASHEQSLTFGGQWLINALQASWPDWERYRWTSTQF